jgi:hypothetical protein
MPATTILADVPVEQLAVSKIKLSKDVENFKENANPITGVVPGDELEGDFERLPSRPIMVWERKNGDWEVITGRHRLDLARRNGEKTIPGQIVRETDGFTREMALSVDAKSNILDGRGKVSDYARFFRTNEITEAEAKRQGLLRGQRGRDGFDIAKLAGDDLYSRFASKAISEDKAAAIARGAPNDEAVQLAAVSEAGNLTADALSVHTRILAEVQRMGGTGKSDQLKLFKVDDSAVRQSKAVAKEAGKEMRRLSEMIRAPDQTLKHPGTAKKMGIDLVDPEATKKLRDEAQSRFDALKKIATNPKLYREMMSRAGLEEASAIEEPAKTPEPAPEAAPEPQGPSMFAPTPAAEAPKGEARRLISEEQYQQFKKTVNEKRLTAGLDVDKLAAWVGIGLYHAENVIRKLGKLTRKAWTAAMREENPDFKPEELRQLWREIVKSHETEIRQLVKESEITAGRAVPPSRDVTGEVIAPPGEPARDTTQLAERAVDDAVAKGMGVGEEGLSTYEVQARKKWTDDALALDPAQAVRIIMGQEMAPHGIKIAAVFEVVKWRAIAAGDMAMIEKLKASPVGEILSKHGQEIAAAGIRNPLDPFEAIKEIETAGKEAAAKRHGKVDPKIVADLEGKLAEANKARDEAIALAEKEHEERAEAEAHMVLAKEWIEGGLKIPKPVPGVRHVTKEQIAQADADIIRLLPMLRKAGGETTVRYPKTEAMTVRSEPNGNEGPTQQIIDALANKAVEYMDSGGTSGMEWAKQIREQFGPDVPGSILRRAWASAAGKLQKAGAGGATRVKVAKGEKISQKDVRDLYMAAMTEGVKGLEERLDYVHEALKEIDPEITREQVRDILTGYGRARVPNQEALQVELRDNVAQHLKLTQLAVMAETGQMPKATGFIRDKPSPEVRELTKQVGEAKKAIPLSDEQIGQHLQSQKDTIVTRLKNQIADLDKQIAAGKRTVREKGGIEYTESMKALVEVRNAKKAVLNEIDPIDFNDPKLAKQRIDAALKHYEKRNAQLQDKLASGDFVTAKKPITWRDDPDSPAKLEALRREAAAKSLSAKVQAVKGMTLSTEQTRQIVDLGREAMKAEEAMRNGKRGKLGDAPNETEMAYGLASVRFDKAVGELKQLAETVTWEQFKTHKVRIGAQVTLAEIGKAVNIGRSLMASMDDSGILRQGYRGITSDLEDVAGLIPRIFGYKGHQGPRFVFTKAAARSFKTIWDTWGGRAVEEAANAGIRGDAAYPKAKTAGIAMGTEEVFPGSSVWADRATKWATDHNSPAALRILKMAAASPFIAFKASENAYKILLHSLRFQLFKRQLAIAEKKGWNTNDPILLKGFGRLVNTQIASGFMKSHPVVDFLLWTPRMLVAHVDFLTAGLVTDVVRYANPKWRADVMPWRIRKLAALQLAEFVGQVAGILLISKLIDPDSVELDPTSSDFGKVKKGNTRIDATGGAGAIVTLGARLATYSSKSSTTGMVTPLNSGEYGAKTFYDVIMDFFGNKLAPFPGEIAQFAKGEDRNMPRISGKPQKPTILRSLARQFTPMPFGTAQQLLADPQAAPFLAAMIADMLGASTNTYPGSPTMTRHFRTEFSAVKVAHDTARNEKKLVPARQQANYYRMDRVNDLLREYDKQAQDPKTAPTDADAIRQRQELASVAALAGKPIFSVLKPQDRHEFAFAYAELLHDVAAKAMTGTGKIDRSALAELNKRAAELKIPQLKKLKSAAASSVHSNYTKLFHAALTTGDVEAGVAYYKARHALGVPGDQQTKSLNEYLKNPDLKPGDAAKIKATWKEVVAKLRRNH